MTKVNRALVLRTALLALSLITALMLGEIFLRLAAKRFRGNVFLSGTQRQSRYQSCRTLRELMETTVIGYKPHTFVRGMKLNSRSFRSPEYTAPKQKGRSRIVVLGDSFVFDSGGVSYKDMWFSVMRRHLEKASGRDWEVISLGVPGGSPTFYRRLWQILESELKADAVILAIFVGNDMTEDQVEKKLSHKRSISIWNKSFMARFIGNTSIYLKEWMRERLTRDGSPSVSEPANIAHMGTFSEEKFLEIEAKRLSLTLDSQQGRLESYLQYTMAHVEKLHQDIRQLGIPLVVVLIPDEYQVDDRLAARILSRQGNPPVDLYRPQREIRQSLDAWGLPYLDLITPFKNEGRPLYWLRNTHWNIEGNALAGRVAAEFIVKNNLFPPRTEGVQSVLSAYQ